MNLFKKKKNVMLYDRANEKPAIRSSICTGEQVAGFKDIHTGKTHDTVLCEKGV